MERVARFRDLPSSDSDDSNWNLSSDSEPEALLNSLKGKRPKQRAYGKASRKRPKKLEELGHVDHSSNDRDVWGQMMPVEILAIIFRLVVGFDGAVPLLPRLGRVCSLWRRVSLLPELWRRVSLVNLPRLTNEVFIRLCTGELNQSKCLEIKACLKLRERGYIAIADNCHKLKRLSVSNVWNYFTATSLEAITQNLDQLECLSLLDLTGGLNSKSVVSAVRLKGSHFRGLSVAGCQKVGRAVVQSIACCCPNLTHLDLSSTLLRTLDIEELQRGCPCLRALHLDHLNICSYSYQQPEEEPPGFKELHILTLADSTLSPAVRTVNRLLSNSLKLHTLDLRAWWDPTYNSLVSALPTSCLNIHQLLVARWKYVNVPDFMDAISVYRHLSELDFSYCPGIDDDAATLLARTPVALSLTSLNLSSTQVTASGLQTIAAACPHLESIDLTGCRGAPRGLKQKHNKEQIQQIRLRFGLI